VLAQITDLVTQANVHYTAAYNDLKNGDFAGFASEMQQVGQILKQLEQLTGTSPTTGASPTPVRASPSPTPTH